MQFTVNWQTTPKGVGLKLGQKVIIDVSGNPDFIAFGFYHLGSPITIGQSGAGKTTSNHAEVIFNNTSLSIPKGDVCTLKINAYKNNVRSGFEKDFIVL